MVNLNRQQKNEIFRIIEKKGLNPKRFSWTTCLPRFTGRITSHILPATALVIQHEEKKFRFTFERDESGAYHSSLIPQITPGENVVFSEDWDGFIHRFEDWLEIIECELEEPDLWKELARGQMLTAIPSDYSQDEKFSIQERQFLAEQLSKIQKFIVESNPLEDTAKIQVRQTFIYLQQRLETSAKIDWKNIFIGAIVSLIVEKVVNNDSEIMKLCAELLSPFFQKLLQ